MAKYLPFAPHQLGPGDVSLFLLSNLICVIALLGPSTPAWRFYRISVMAPLAAAIHLYCGYYAVPKCYEDHWGSIINNAAWAIRVFQHLVFFPAETHCFRVDHKSSDQDETAGGGATVLVAEPIPPPWSLARFYWAWSLVWTHRGLGWNFSPPLVPAADHPPFRRGSSRKHFVIRQLRDFFINLLLIDIIRTYMNNDPSASAFFSLHQPHYSDLTQWQRAVLSTCVALRICLGMSKFYFLASIFMVSLGGYMGWEGEMWSTWGWPPLYGTLRDIWVYPGLSVAWSRLWHQYFRQWLYLFGWVGLGENIFRLQRTGPDPKFPLNTKSPSTPGSTLAQPGTPSPSVSGRTSPTHPVPTRPTRRPSPYLTNLIKSLCVFTLTGLIHDYGFYFLMYFTNPHTHGKTWAWSDALVTTPFFVIQPLGLAVEAAVKKTWRGWKQKNRPEWEAGEPEALVLCERIIGFIWTWTFLGWTARWFVDGVARTGLYKRDDNQGKLPTLFGGLVYGVWKH